MLQSAIPVSRESHRAWPYVPTWFRSGHWNRLLLACALIGLLIGLFNPNYRWAAQRTTPYGADFLQEWVAGDMILDGAAAQIYDRELFAAWQHDRQRVGFDWPHQDYYPAVYPPTYYLILSPLAHLPYRLAPLVWLAGLLACYALAARTAELLPIQISPVAAGSAFDRSAAMYWAACLVMPCVFFGLVIGQKGSVWMLIVALVMHAHCRGQSTLAGMLAAVLTLKPTLCWLLPLAMLLDRQWRFCIAFTLATCGLHGWTLAVIPSATWFDYLAVVRGAVTYGAHSGYRPGWAANALAAGAYFGVPLAARGLVWFAILITVLAGLAFRGRQNRALARHRDPGFWLLVLSGTSLLSPHFYFYDLVWLLVPLRSWMKSCSRGSVFCVGLLWIGALAAQLFETGVPLMPLVLAGIIGTVFATDSWHGSPGVTD